MQNIKEKHEKRLNCKGCSKLYLISKYSFLFIAVVTIIRSFIHIFASDGGAQSIATIPLDLYSKEAADAVIYTFSVWGLSQLLMGIVYLAVFIRYAFLIPFMYVLLVTEYLSRIIIGMMKPVIITGTAPGSVGNYLMVPLCTVLLVFFLCGKPKK